jgi:hypothetical protein
MPRFPSGVKDADPAVVMVEGKKNTTFPSAHPTTLKNAHLIMDRTNES